jgi:hypothetical protein
MILTEGEHKPLVAVWRDCRAGIVNARAGDARTALAGHHLTSLFSSPLWADVLALTYGFEISAVLGGPTTPSGAAVVFSRVSDVRGERIISLPFSDYCDPLVRDLSDWNEVIDPVLWLGVPVTLRCLQNEVPARDRRFTRVGQALWHGVDLTPSEEMIWARLAGSARQNVRKAHRNGVIVRDVTSVDGVRIFHEMHCRLRKRKYRLLAQSLDFFEKLYEVFAPGNNIIVLLAEVAGRPVAGILLLVWGDTLYYKFNASSENGLGANDILAWEAVRLGRERRLLRLDFGRSDHSQPGLIRYKRKYASEEREIVTLRHEPHNWSDRRGEETTRLLTRITQLLTQPDVPDQVSKAAGDELYRYFC